MQSQRLREFLLAYHSRYAGVTELAMAALATSERGATSYDALADEVSARVPHNGAVLDVGCGSGALLAALRARRRDLRLQGIDLSEEELALARARVSDALLQQGDVFQDALHGPFDAITAHLVLFLLGRVGPVLQRFSRVLAPGGIVACVVEDIASSHRRFFEMVTGGLRVHPGTLDSDVLAGVLDMGVVENAAAVFQTAGFDLLVDRRIEVRASSSQRSAAQLVAYAYPFGILSEQQRNDLEADIATQLATEDDFVFPLRVLIAQCHPEPVEGRHDQSSRRPSTSSG